MSRFEKKRTNTIGNSVHQPHPGQKRRRNRIGTPIPLRETRALEYFALPQKDWLLRHEAFLQVRIPPHQNHRRSKLFEELP